MNCLSGLRLGLVAVLMFTLLTAIAPTVAAGEQPKMYFLLCFEGCVIHRANLDGSDISPFLAETRNSGLGIDIVNRKLYYADFLIGELPTVNRSNLDGSNQTVIDTANSVFDNLGGYAVDLIHGKVYWVVATDINQGIVKRANLNGSDVEIVVADAPNPQRIAVDPFGQKIYWTDAENGNHKIQRADLDGSNIEILVTAEDVEPDTFFQPSSVAVDHRNGKMYWTDTGLPEFRIQRSNLDGSDVETLLRDEDLPDGGFPARVALDLDEEKMYFSDVGGGGFILRANLDGSSVETLIAFDLPFGGPADIVLDPIGTVPVPAASPWGVLLLTLLLLVAMTPLIVRRVERAGPDQFFPVT